jgi:uncharacterized membrane protein
MARAPRPLVLATLYVGCTGGPSVDTAACSDAERMVNWENFGAAFFQDYCMGCHAVGVDDRYGAPTDLNLQTLAQVRTHADAIRRTVLDTGSMPVGGGVDEESLVLLDTFLACGL